MTPAVTTREPERDWPCPVCEATLVEGQGLFACTDCGWSGTVTHARHGLRWTTNWD